MKELESVSRIEIDEEDEYESSDFADHTFSGIMFGLECPAGLAIEKLVIRSVWIRGELGPISVWWTKGEWRGEKQSDASQWTKVFSKIVMPSYHHLIELELDSPIELIPGDRIALYVHSALRNDQGIVYDNKRVFRQGFFQSFRNKDKKIKYLLVHSGAAHLSSRPFASYHPWGAWRNHREFVGKIQYGVKHLLWTPANHHVFPPPFKRLVRLLLVARAANAHCLFASLPEDIVFFIIHFCKSDWVSPNHFPCHPSSSTKSRSSSSSWTDDKTTNQRPAAAGGHADQNNNTLTSLTSFLPAFLRTSLRRLSSS